MKKSLIALAVAGTFAAPAMAATSNVDIYGLLNVAVESVDNDNERHSRLTTGNNSAIGFKGTEDLGGGLKGVWQIETNVSIDGDSNSAGGTAAGAFNGTRNTYLGLAGGFGTVLFGTHDTPYKMATGRLDNFVGTLGDYNSIMGAIGGDASAQFDLRTSNTIAYVSPDFSGFKIVAGYVLSGENNLGVNNVDESDAYSLSATYTNGPLFVTAAYEDHSLYGAASAGGGTIVLGNGAGAEIERDAWKVGIGYAFGDLTLGAVYENISVDAGAADTERDAWMVQASYAMGPMTFKAMYMDAEEADNTNDTGADQWTVGLDYALSKRTKAYFVYSSLDNDSNGTYALGQGSNVVRGSAAGAEQDGFALGVVHSF
jgi:predicted porin